MNPSQQLFPHKSKNLLPCDGEATYYGAVLSHELSAYYFSPLLETIEWKNDEVVLFGKRIITQRKVAWYAKSDFLYAYSGMEKKALPWTSQLNELKELVENISGSRYNSCLLNLYHHGNEGMGWHSDDEDTLERNASIASLGLGADRKFSFKHKATGQSISLFLENGSLLDMKGATQTYWLHSLPKSKKIMLPRINLTFRKFREKN